MARVTDAEVLEIMQGVPSTKSLTPFITIANVLINKVIVEKYPDEYTEDFLKEIERWLSAHFVAIDYNKTASETIGPVSEWYQHKVGLNFNVTMYGQQVLLLDTTGSFAALQKQAEKGKRSANMAWLGTLGNEYSK